MDEQPISNTKLIYFVGVPSVGKTTLITATHKHLSHAQPALRVSIVKEVARDIIAKDGVEREDIRSGNSEAMLLQRKILETQATTETNVEETGLILLDRSGIDPIAFTKMYGSQKQTQNLLECEAWHLLKDRMARALVILCEPVPAWLTDDGVRLIPKHPDEWSMLHSTFSTLLDQEGIRYVVMPGSMTELEARIQFVISRIQSVWPSDN